MPIYIWAIFILFIVLMLGLDLGLFHKKPHAIPVHEALGWTLFWIILALIFNIIVYRLYDHHAPGSEQAAYQYFTGYLIEKSLSLDNIFVIALIFSYFRVPLSYQHRILFWGILGAIIMRAIMILSGTYLMNQFSWFNYVFGVLLFFTAVKMFTWQNDNLEPEKNLVLRIARRFIPVSSNDHGIHFFIQKEGKWFMTPLFICLLVIESTDLLFAIDSIPAILAITQDPFLVFTSNIFAILGLRSLYFALAAAIEKFRYMKVSLAFILAFVAVKMLLAHSHPLETDVSLFVIVGILAMGIFASILNRDHIEKILPFSQEIESMARMTYYNGRKLFILILGSTIVLIGLVMIVLPGPAIIVIPIGLGVLATEFVWAKKLFLSLKQKIRRMVTKENIHPPDTKSS